MLPNQRRRNDWGPSSPVCIVAEVVYFNNLRASSTDGELKDLLEDPHIEANSV